MQSAVFLLSLKQLMGRENFLKGMQKYITDNRGKMVDSDCFFKAMEQCTTVPVKKFYYDFLDKPGFAEYSTLCVSSVKSETRYLHSVEIANTSNKDFFSAVAIHPDIQQDTMFLYIPAGEKKEITIQSNTTDTSVLRTVDPEQVFLVRKQGIRSPGAKCYTDDCQTFEIKTNQIFYSTTIFLVTTPLSECSTTEYTPAAIPSMLNETCCCVA